LTTELFYITKALLQGTTLQDLAGRKAWTGREAAVIARLVLASPGKSGQHGILIRAVKDNRRGKVPLESLTTLTQPSRGPGGVGNCVGGITSRRSA